MDVQCPTSDFLGQKYWSFFSRDGASVQTVVWDEIIREVCRLGPEFVDNFGWRGGVFLPFGWLFF